MGRVNATHIQNLVQLGTLVAPDKDNRNAKLLGKKNGELYVCKGGLSKLIGRVTGTRAKERHYAKLKFQTLIEKLPDSNEGKKPALFSMARRIQSTEHLFSDMNNRIKDAKNALGASDVYMTSSWLLSDPHRASSENGSDDASRGKRRRNAHLLSPPPNASPRVEKSGVKRQLSFTGATPVRAPSESDGDDAGLSKSRRKAHLVSPLPNASPRIEMPGVARRLEYEGATPVRAPSKNGASKRVETTNNAAQQAKFVHDLETVKHELVKLFSTAMADPDKGAERALTGHDAFMQKMRPVFSDRLSEPALTTFLDDAFQLAANRRLHSEVLGKSSTRIARQNGKPLYDIKLGDPSRVYRPITVGRPRGAEEVFVYRDVNSDKTIAVTISKATRKAGREALLHKKAAAGSNSGVVGFEGAAFTKDGELYHAKELTQNVDLKDAFSFIDSAVRVKQLSEQQASAMRKTWAQDAALTLGELHNKNLHYRSLKPENMSLSENGTAKASDFGALSEGIVRPLAGTVAHAPQTNAKILYQRNSNLQSLGEFFAETMGDRKSANAGGLDSLLTRMLDDDPDKRPTAQDVAEDPYFVTDLSVGSGETRGLMRAVLHGASAAKRHGLNEANLATPALAAAKAKFDAAFV